MTPDLQKSSKNEIFPKHISTQNHQESLNSRSGQDYWYFLWILGSYFGYKDFVIFEKFHDLGPAKRFKNLKFLEKFFLLRTIKKVLIHVLNNILGSFREF